MACAASHQESDSYLSEDDLRCLVERIDRRDQPKTRLSQLEIDRLHFLSDNFEEAHPRALEWAFDTAQRGLMN